MIGIITGARGVEWISKLFNGHIIGSSFSSKKECINYLNNLGYTLYEVD